MLQWIPPALLLSALLCIAYASLLHLWGGRSLRDLLVYIAAAVGGFAVGQLLGRELGLSQAEIDRQVADYVAATAREKSILTGVN